jgi:hypothetical protein
MSERSERAMIDRRAPKARRVPKARVRNERSE